MLRGKKVRILGFQFGIIFGGAPERPQCVKHEVVGGHFGMKNEGHEEANEGEEVKPKNQNQHREAIDKLGVGRTWFLGP